MRISDIMNLQAARTGPDMPFTDLLQAMRDMPSRLLHVVDDQGRLLGVISSYDVLKVMLPFYVDANLARVVTDEEGFARRLLAENAHLTAADIMNPRPLTLREDSHFLEAEALIKQREINALTVLDADGRVAGEVTRQIILDTLIGLGAQPRTGNRQGA